MRPEDWRDPRDPTRIFYRSGWEPLVIAAVTLAAFVLGLLVYCNTPGISVPTPPPG